MLVWFLSDLHHSSSERRRLLKAAFWKQDYIDPSYPPEFPASMDPNYASVLQPILEGLQEGFNKHEVPSPITRL
jgi:hypothetical protein